MRKKKLIVMICFLVIVAVLIGVSVVTPGKVADPDNYACAAYATVFALLPPVVAIALALITKEVYSSLFTGIIVGALLYSNGNLELMMNTMFFNESGGMVFKLANSWNIGILIFLVMLGMLVALMNKAGLKTILQAIEYVKKGISICIFPEGTRGDSDEMAPFKEGSMKIAEKTGCPIVPMAISHTRDIIKDHMPFVKPTHVTVEYGAPIYPKELAKEERRALGRLSQNMIQEMLDAQKASEQ